MRNQPYRSRDRRVLRWLLLGLLLLFGGMYAALVLYTGQRIPHGTRVEGIAVGGLRPAAAQDKLSAGLGGRAAEPMTVSANGERSSLRPSSAGFGVDVAATVDRVRTHRSWDPRRLWDYFAGAREREAVVRVDTSRLDDSIGRFADQADTPAVEGGVTFSRGLATATYPHKGTVVDREAAAAAVRRAFLHAQGPDDVVALPMQVATPEVSKTAVSRAMDDFANPAVSAPVVVRLAGEGVQLQPEDYTPALSMVPDGDSLRPALDDATLLRLLRPKMRQIDRAPRDARVVVRAGRPHVLPAKRGVTFRDVDVSRRFLPVLTRAGARRTLSVRSRPARPKVTTAEARGWRITEQVSGFSTSFPFAVYRNVNIGRASRLIDGTVLQPGETFSLNETVGERTPENGFAKGYIIADGVYAQDYGGGVSQVATTTFNAAFFAGLEDVEHKAHSFYIDRYPVGREATVAWPHTDLKFENSTPYSVLIKESTTRATPTRRGTLTVRMYSTKYWDISTSKSGRYDATPPHTRRLSGPGCVPNAGYGGFDIDVHRVFRRHGSSKVTRRETMHTVYTPSDTVVCR